MIKYHTYKGVLKISRQVHWCYVKQHIVLARGKKFSNSSGCLYKSRFGRCVKRYCDSEKSCWLLFVTHYRMCQYGDKERLSTWNCIIAKDILNICTDQDHFL